MNRTKHIQKFPHITTRLVRFIFQKMEDNTVCVIRLAFVVGKGWKKRQKFFLTRDVADRFYSYQLKQGFHKGYSKAKGK